MKVAAYLEITMKINPENCPAATKVYTDYRGPFLEQIDGALTKEFEKRMCRYFTALTAQPTPKHISKVSCSQRTYS